MRRTLGDLDYKALERSGFGWTSDEQMADKKIGGAGQDAPKYSPYETPHVAQLLSVEFSQSPGEVVSDTNVVGILHEIL